MEATKEPLLDQAFELSLQRVDTRMRVLESLNAECAAMITKVSITQPHTQLAASVLPKQPKYASRMKSNLISL